MTAAGFGIICLSICQVIIAIWLVQLGRRITIWSDFIQAKEKQRREDMLNLHMGMKRIDITIKKYLNANKTSK